MPAEQHVHEISDLRDRQTRIEQAVSNLAETTKALVDNQQTIQEGQTKIAAEMQGVLTLLQARDGQINLKMVLPVTGLLVGVLGPLAAMFLAPVRAQLDYNTQEIHAIRDSGSPVSRRAIDVLDERVRSARSDIDRLDAADRRRLEEEASLGRQLLYNRSTPPVTVTPPAVVTPMSTLPLVPPVLTPPALTLPLTGQK